MNEEMINFFKAIPGAISVTEAFGLYYAIIENLSTDSKDEEVFVDFGSYAGKSSFVALTALSFLKRKGLFIMIEPAFDPNGSFRRTGPVFSTDNYLQTIKEYATRYASSDLAVTLVGLTSEEFTKKENDIKEISYAFIDTGEHSKYSIDIELSWILPRIKQGGLVAFHDYGNQYTAPGYAIEALVSTGKFNQIVIDWEPIFKVVALNDLEKNNDSWHMVGADHPNFVGIVRKR